MTSAHVFGILLARDTHATYQHYRPPSTMWKSIQVWTLMFFATPAGLPAAGEPPDAHLARHRVALPVLPHLEDDPLRLRDGRRPVGKVARMDGGRPAGLARTHRTQLLRQLPHLRPALMDGKVKGKTHLGPFINDVRTEGGSGQKVTVDGEFAKCGKGGRARKSQILRTSFINGFLRSGYREDTEGIALEFDNQARMNARHTMRSPLFGGELATHELTQ